MKKEFIMVDLTTGGHAVIRVSEIDIITDTYNGGVLNSFCYSIIYYTQNDEIETITSTQRSEEIYTMITTEST
jgi:hypothetical protein